MGWARKEYTAACGEYLLNLLLLEGRIEIRYSEHFYDGSDELSDKLAESTGVDSDEVSIYFDHAAAQLEKQGFVKITMLEKELMADGEPDYLISLTRQGIERFEIGEVPKYWDMDL